MMKRKWVQVYACNFCDNTQDIGMNECFSCDRQVCFDCRTMCEGCAKYGVCPVCEKTATEFKNDGTEEDDCDPHRIKVHGDILCGGCIFDLIKVQHSIGCIGTRDGKEICCERKKRNIFY